jgi:hypothetical protein
VATCGFSPPSHSPLNPFRGTLAADAPLWMFFTFSVRGFVSVFMVGLDFMEGVGYSIPIFCFFPIIWVGLFGLNSFGFAPPHLYLVQLFVSKMEVVCFLSGWLCLWIRLCAWPCRHCVWVMSDLYAGIVCTWICPCWRLVHSSFLTVTNSHSTFFFYSSFESVHEFSR